MYLFRVRVCVQEIYIYISMYKHKCVCGVLLVIYLWWELRVLLGV